MRKTTKRIVVLAAISLAGCSSDYDTRTYGVGRSAQEESRLTAPAPLSLPPILTEGRARPDAPPAGAGPAVPGLPVAPRAKAPQSLVASSPPSSGEESLLEAAGPSVAGDIRERVDQEAQIGRADPAYSDALLSAPVGPRSPDQPPIIQRETKSWVDSIF